jgi:carbonic anhydrase/acetyltransferase-like protein (isoleucine patch superfamily)
MKKKYELTKESIVHEGVTLYRIKALKDFGRVKKGDLGGFIEKESNLSHDGDCWVGGIAKVYNEACVFERARVGEFAQVYDFARIGGRSSVFGSAKIYEFANIGGHTYIYGNCQVLGHVVIGGRASVCDYANLSGFILVYEKATVEGFYLASGRKILGGRVCYGGGDIRPFNHY